MHFAPNRGRRERMDKSKTKGACPIDIFEKKYILLPDTKPRRFIMDTAKVFMTGRSQAVRLPKKYRFDTSEVEIRKHGHFLIMSPIPSHSALDAFLALPCCPDFHIDRESAQSVEEREIFP